MPRYDPSTSILAGMSADDLRARLAALQAAYLDLSAGARAVTISYAQGDGNKSVTYDRAELGQVNAAIRLIQAQLGAPVTTPRRPIRVRF